MDNSFINRCKTLETRILSCNFNDIDSNDIENEMFNTLNQATYNNPQEASAAISVLLTYISYSNYDDTFTSDFPKNFVSFLFAILQSNQRSTREMSFVLISALSNTSTLESIMLVIADQFQLLKPNQVKLLLSFCYEFDSPLNHPWMSLMDSAKQCGNPDLDSNVREFVHYMETQQPTMQSHHQAQILESNERHDVDILHQLIHNLRDENWEIQLKSVEKLTQLIESNPDDLTSYAKTTILNLLDTFNCPRSVLKIPALKLAIKLVDTYPSQIAIYAPKYVELAIKLSSNTLKCIANDASALLLLIATKIPRELCLTQFKAGAKDNSPITRAKIALCFEKMVETAAKNAIPIDTLKNLQGEPFHVGGPLTDHEFAVFIRAMAPLLHDNEEKARTCSKRVLQKLMKDSRFSKMSHDVILGQDDYDMMMDDLRKE